MEIKRGDLEPDFEVTLLDGGEPVDLTSATEVRIVAVRAGGQPFFSRPVASRSAQGVVSMSWEEDDTEVVRTLLLEVPVTWPGSRTQTFPVDGPLVVRVVPDLG